MVFEGELSRLASNKEEKIILSTAYVIYLIYSNDECMLRIMGHIGSWTSALSGTYPVEPHRNIKLRIMGHIGSWTATLSGTYPVEPHRNIKRRLRFFLIVLGK